MTDPKSSLQSFQGTIHLVFSSHWDREWYLPFQKFRGKLVKTLDAIFAALESGRLPFYQMDGQFLPVEDYLQIRPEKETLVRRLITEGRFVVGPWYNLSDGFLVSGESLVRNFLMGMRRAEAFGRTGKVGWMCDIFGHNSQMPQILSQLGIEGAIVWRGVDTHIDNPFKWKSPDGSSVSTFRFFRNGYCDFDFEVRKCITNPETPTVGEMVKNALSYFEETRQHTTASNLLWADAGDHIDFDPAVLDLAAELNRLAGRELVKVSTLEEFMAHLAAETAAAPALEGELRTPCPMGTLAWLIPGVASSRVPLKQANHACETLLTLWAEPWCAAAAHGLGAEYPARALELAWEYLLKNHPHDSICGCSTDETHAAMPYRFDQCRQIAEFHLDTAFRAVSGAALAGKLQTGEIGLSLFAPQGGATYRSPEVTVRLPKDWPQFNEFFGFETKPIFRVYDLENREVPYQLLQVQPSTIHSRVLPNHFPWTEERQGARIALDTDIAPGETRHYLVRRVEGIPVRLSQKNAIGVGRATLRNEFLEVTAADNGTLSLKSLESGQTHHGLLALEDTADIGDGWYHGVALQDRAFLSTGGQVTFGLSENGPLLARLHVRVEWPVPEAFDFKTNERSRALTPLVVEHVVTLRKGNRHVEIDTTVHNQARDHRLRALFPSGLKDADRFWADTPFDAIERPVALREDNHLLRELQVEMTPQQNWVATSDSRHGLAVLAPGQYESAVLDQPDRPLCVTLLRAFRRAVMTDGNDGGQIQGTHCFHMAIAPFTGSVPTAGLFQLAQSIAAAPRYVTQEAPEIPSVPQPEPKVRPRIEGNVVLSSACLDASQQWCFRIFNPESEPATLRLSEGFTWKNTDFRGNAAETVSGPVLTIGAKKIVTLRANAR